MKSAALGKAPRLLRVLRSAGLPCAALAFSTLVSCDGDSPESRQPQTPQEMYARAQELLRPNVEHHASDFAGALEYLKKAAEGGLLQAQTDLAALYLEGGKGVEKNPALAYEWFAKAAAAGSKEAHVFLGILEYEGRGAAKDLPGAVAHWRIAAESGIADAQYRLGMALVQKADSMQEGVEWLQKAARPGSRDGEPAAATALGNIYANGTHGVQKDMALSAQWYERAAGAGDARAQMVFAVMLLTGDPVEKDAERGMAMLRMSAGQDNPQAIALLVRLLRNAENADDNEPEAAAWSKRLEQLSKKK